MYIPAAYLLPWWSWCFPTQSSFSVCTIWNEQLHFDSLPCFVRKQPVSSRTLRLICFVSLTIKRSLAWRGIGCLFFVCFQPRACFRIFGFLGFLAFVAFGFLAFVAFDFLAFSYFWCFDFWLLVFRLRTRAIEGLKVSHKGNCINQIKFLYALLCSTPAPTCYNSAHERFKLQNAANKMQNADSNSKLLQIQCIWLRGFSLNMLQKIQRKV